MAFVPVPNTALVESVYMLDGQIVENTVYMTSVDPPTITTLAEMIEFVNLTIREQLIPSLVSAIQLLRVVGTLIDVLDGLVYVSTTSLPLSGGDTSAPLPSNTTVCCSLRTDHSGRSFRGRNYIPGMPDAAVTFNTVSVDFRNNVNHYFDVLRSGASELGWHHTVVSRFSGFTIVSGKKVPTPRVTGIATPVVNTLFVDNTIDSQRRRLPGRGS